MMTIPDVIVANNISKGADIPRGIIYHIRESVTNDNILSFVAPSTNYGSYNGKIENPIKQTDLWQGLSNQNGYYQIEFKGRFVFPTAYSLKGYNAGGFAKEWYFYGINDGEDPTLLAEGSNEGSTYCGSGTACNSLNWATFELKSVTKAFRYFRIKIKTPSSSGSWHMLYTGIDIFGTLSFNGRITAKTRKSICYKSIPVNSHFHSYLVLRFAVYIS